MGHSTFHPDDFEPQRAARRLKVLIVDDSADLVEMLSLVVERAGHEVQKALDGQTALSAARTFQPDVLLLDLGLPDMSGIDVAHALRRDPATAGVCLVALTGRGQVEDQRQTAEAGFDRHLTKPTEPDSLLQLLAELSQANRAGGRL